MYLAPKDCNKAFKGEKFPIPAEKNIRRAKPTPHLHHLRWERLLLINIPRCNMNIAVHTELSIGAAQFNYIIFCHQINQWNILWKEPWMFWKYWSIPHDDLSDNCCFYKAEHDDLLKKVMESPLAMGVSTKTKHGSSSMRWATWGMSSLK